MKNTSTINIKSSFILVLALLFLAAGCTSDFGSGFNASGGGDGSSVDPGDPNPTDPITGACSDYSPLPNAYDVQRRHVYLGEFRFDVNGNPQKAYRQFLGDFGKFCANNSNGQWRTNPITGQYEYFYGWYNGVSNCSNWDDIAKVWISFPKGNPQKAHLTIDATMSGYPDGWQGQGYDTQRIQLSNAQIDCTVEDKTVIVFEPVMNYQFKAVIYKGNKSTEHIRTELFYKNASLGRNDMFIVTQ